MADKDIIYDYVVKKNSTALTNEFSYDQVRNVATICLEKRTYAGYDYAVLTFLKRYCECVKPSLGVNSQFFMGDPRRFGEVGAVRTEWRFKLKVVDNQSRPIDESKNISMGNKKSIILDGDSRYINESNNTLITTKIGCEKCSYHGFVRFIVEQLSVHSEPEYTWKYSIRDSVDWLDEGLRSGSTLSSAGQVLSIAGRVMHKAINSKDQNLCYEGVRAIMDWGGVYYPQGPKQGNKEGVEKLHKERDLWMKIQNNCHSLNSGKPENVSLMNAGWTKIWAALYPEKFVIFDSRVSFAFSNLLKEYCDLHCEKKGDGSYPFANTFGYRQIKQGKRDVNGFKSVNNNPVHWARSMFVVSDILKVCMAYADSQNIDIYRYSPKNLRSLEARLFIRGR